MSAPLRCRAEAKAVASQLPMPDEARVRNVLAAAGGSLPSALAVLAAAIARLVVERVPGVLHELTLAGVAHAIVQQVILRRQQGGRG